MTTPRTGEATAAGIDLERRDLTLDLARVFCVLLVVVVHLLFVGVGTNASGAIVVSRPLELLPWFPLASWFGQIMPLFFVVGGFATLTSLRSRRRREPDAGVATRVFAHERIQRLARPAFPLFVVLAVVLLGATIAGVDPELLGSVAVGIGSPLWFLCAYLGCQLLAPALGRLHEHAPRRTVLALLVGVILVDALHYGTGVELWGYLNLLFAWPLIQQFGFWYADGWFARRRWWQLVLIAAACWASLVPMTLWGPYSDNMLTNLNPPTLPLVALGLGQAAVLQLLAPPLSALMRTRPARTVVFVIGSRLMTIYLWHVPLLVAIAGLGLLIPGASPEPGSAAWWAWRPVIYLVVLALVFALSLLVGRLERPLPVARPAGIVALAVAAVLTITPTFLITVRGLDAALAIGAALGFGVALLLLGAAQKPKSPPKSLDPKSAAPKSVEPKSVEAASVSLDASSDAVES